MACMEHVCAVPGCTYVLFDNTRYGKPCPKHGTDQMRHHFDEQEPPDDDGDEGAPDEESDD